MQSQRLTFVLALWPTHWNPVLCFSRLLSADWFRHLFWQEHFRQGLLDHRERGSARAFLSSQGAMACAWTPKSHQRQAAAGSRWRQSFQTKALPGWCNKRRQQRGPTSAGLQDGPPQFTTTARGSRHEKLP